MCCPNLLVGLDVYKRQVLTTFEGNRVTMAATDGFRLSVRSAHIAGYVEKPFHVIIPARALNEVGRIITDDLEALYISMPAGRNQIIFDMEKMCIRDSSKTVQRPSPLSATQPRRSLNSGSSDSAAAVRSSSQERTTLP